MYVTSCPPTVANAALPPWPYPRWIAHRGAGTLAPENTLAAFRLGAQCGYRMFECDVRLSGDGVLFLLHDDFLDRTTDGQGQAAAWPMAALAALDAGRWHSPRFAGERLPTLAALVRWCCAKGLGLNVEIKPNPGQGAETGEAVGHLLSRLWPAHLAAPLLTSFDPAALAGAQKTAPHWPRGLLADQDRPMTQDIAQAQSLGCLALVRPHGHWSGARIAQAHSSGLRALAYTVNDAATAQRLIAGHIDGLITDRVDVFHPRPTPLFCSHATTIE